MPQGKCERLKYALYLFNPFTKKWKLVGKFCTLKDITGSVDRNYKQIFNIYNNISKKDCEHIKIKKLSRD